MSFTEDTITFGKYKDLTLSVMLRDRKYCLWLLQQDWFSKQYEYLYNQVRNYNPEKFFYSNEMSRNEENNFLTNYKYFQLLPIEELKIELTENEKKCYTFYLDMIQNFKDKILNNIDPNPYNIKAPKNWLQNFEKKYELSRDIFKEFLNAYELPNLPYIIEDIKAVGGIVYKGARSFLIAKENSLKQERFWEEKLKEKYGEDIGTQFKYKNCIFDFIYIKTNTIYECKLSLKDFNEDQHNKYLITLNIYNIIYLIGTDCIIDISNKKLYTNNHDKYYIYILNIPIMKDPSKFDKLIEDIKIEEVTDLNLII